MEREISRDGVIPQGQHRTDDESVLRAPPGSSEVVVPNVIVHSEQDEDG